jgi:hypothetical protein
VPGPSRNPSTGPSAGTACVTPAREPTADATADGRADRIAAPSRDGAGPTLTFGVGSAHEATVGVRARRRRGLPARPAGHMAGGAGVHDLFMARRPPADDELEEIVDRLFLPLVRHVRGRPNGQCPSEGRSQPVWSG